MTHEFDGTPTVRGAIVVKLGGRALEAEGALAELAADLATLGAPVVLVHGGGAEVTKWCERLGIESRFEQGLRVTDAATLEVAAAVLAGLANKRLVAGLRAHDVDAVGLAAIDGVCEVSLHPDAKTLGEVGAVESVNTTLLESLLAQGHLPVLASIGADEGRLLNVNADDLAAAVAAALHARLLVLLSDTPGVRLEGAFAPRLDRAALDAALTHPDVQGGMTAKLRAAAAALDGGAHAAVITEWSGAGTLAAIAAGDAHGTRLEPAPREEALHG